MNNLKTRQLSRYSDEFWLPAAVSDFSRFHRIQANSVTEPVSYTLDSDDSFFRLKWPGHETDESFPSSAEAENN
jgi:hypothetical protein